MNGFLSLWPQQASAHAGRIDLLMSAFTILVVILSGPVFLLIFAFAVRYRRGKDVNREHAANRNMWLEVSWSAVPFVAILGFYVWATWLYFGLHDPPPDTLNIDVVAKQWMWKVQHEGGQSEIDELHVPVDQPIKLIMTSQDVIHSFFVPALRIKQDVLPGRYTTMWFTADKPGTYWLTCAEFCGTDHAVMGGKFYVMKPDDYARWLERAGVDMTLAAEGEGLFRQYGCGGCHGPASSVHAPALDGLFGRPVALEGGETVIADEQYIRDSILLPQKKVAAGYKPIMPTYTHLLSEDAVLKLVAYIKSLGATRKGAE